LAEQDKLMSYFDRLFP